MRLWYQETVMERKQSWGGFTESPKMPSPPTQPPMAPMEAMLVLWSPFSYQLGVNVRNGLCVHCL